MFLLRVLVLVFIADVTNVWFKLGKTCREPAVQKEPETTHLNGAARGAMLLDSSGSGEPPRTVGCKGT